MAELTIQKQRGLSEAEMEYMLQYNFPTPPDLEVIDKVAELALQAGMLKALMARDGLTEQQAKAMAQMKILAGKERNIAPTVALALINIIQGNASMDYKLVLALIRRDCKTFDIKFTKIEDQKESIVEVTRDGKNWKKWTQTIAMHEKTNYYQKNPNWKSIPHRMLLSKNIQQFGSMMFGDILMGMMTTDEAEDIKFATEFKGNVFAYAPKSPTLTEEKPVEKPKIRTSKEDALALLNALPTVISEVEDPEEDIPEPPEEEPSVPEPEEKKVSSPVIPTNTTADILDLPAGTIPSPPSPSKEAEVFTPEPPKADPPKQKTVKAQKRFAEDELDAILTSEDKPKPLSQEAVAKTQIISNPPAAEIPMITYEEFVKRIEEKKWYGSFAEDNIMDKADPAVIALSMAIATVAPTDKIDLAKKVRTALKKKVKTMTNLQCAIETLKPYFIMHLDKLAQVAVILDQQK